MTMTDLSPSTALRFNGSLWCNMDVALRTLDHVMSKLIEPRSLTLIEWYILRALYERDGQHASTLAQSVGRAATSFTPNLDKLQDKGLIERRPDNNDRRAVHIYLTEAANQHRETVLDCAERIDAQFVRLFDCGDMKGFLNVLGSLQTIDVDQLAESHDPHTANA